MQYGGARDLSHQTPPASAASRDVCNAANAPTAFSFKGLAHQPSTDTATDCFRTCD